jgi:hypothetical protein
MPLMISRKAKKCAFSLKKSRITTVHVQVRNGSHHLLTLQSTLALGTLLAAVRMLRTTLPRDHLLICLFCLPGVEAQHAQVTNPENALGLCRVDQGHVKNVLPALERPSMIPRPQHPNVNAVKTSTISSARTSITGPQLHPSRQGLGPRSLSDPSFRSKPDSPPFINHSRSWSLKSLIPRRIVTKSPVKPNDYAIVRFINQKGYHLTFKIEVGRQIRF